jgi:hypothetical protein
MAGQLTNRHLVRGLLQLENLLVHKLAFFMVHHIGVEGAVLTRLIAGLLVSSTPSWEGQTSKSTVNMDIFAVIAVLATDMNNGRL